MTTEIKSIISQIDSMREELNYIKKHMVNRDEIMTLSEFEAYKDSFNKKNLVSFSNAKKQLGF
ncbi:MAG: hypothetical protein ACMXYE_04420 [Candidatus Woesearchaeota archaeon]